MRHRIGVQVAAWPSKFDFAVVFDSGDGTASSSTLQDFAT